MQWQEVASSKHTGDSPSAIKRPSVAKAQHSFKCTILKERNGLHSKERTVQLQQFNSDAG